MKVKPYFFITFSEVEVFTMSSFPAPVYPGDSRWILVRRYVSPQNGI
jgi:hypothetical protein